MNHQYRIGDMNITQDHVYITDADGPMSITNAAEQVVWDMHQSGALRGRRLFYKDTNGDIDELLHDGQGGFRGFKLGHEGVAL